MNDIDVDQIVFEMARRMQRQRHLVRCVRSLNRTMACASVADTLAVFLAVATACIILDQRWPVVPFAAALSFVTCLSWFLRVRADGLAHEVYALHQEGVRDE